MKPPSSSSVLSLLEHRAIIGRPREMWLASDAHEMHGCFGFDYERSIHTRQRLHLDGRQADESWGPSMLDIEYGQQSHSMLLIDSILSRA